MLPAPARARAGPATSCRRLRLPRPFAALGGADGEEEIAILRIDPALETQQVERVREVRVSRDEAAAQEVLDRLREGATAQVNLMPLLVECAHARLTEGEIVRTLKGVFGTWRETPVF